MATQRQIEANRRNAQKSTGPRTPEGKSVSRLNALKCGIDSQLVVVPGEDPEVLEELALEYHNRFQATTPEERLMVDAMIHSEWLLRRYRRVEAEMWKHRLKEFSRVSRKNPLGDVYGRSLEAFNRLQRRIDSAERTYRRSLAEIRRLQSEAERAHSSPQTSPVPDLRDASLESHADARVERHSPQELTPEIGFVPPEAAPGARPMLVRTREEQKNRTESELLTPYCEPRA